MVRDEPQDGRGRHGGEGALPQRRLLRRERLLLDGDPRRSLHADLRRVAGGGLDRPHPRAVRRQPPHLAGKRVRRASPPFVRADRPARLTMKISEIMTKATVTDSAEDTLAEACEKMRHAQTSSMLIMD